MRRRGINEADRPPAARRSFARGEPDPATDPEARKSTARRISAASSVTAPRPRRSLHPRHTSRAHAPLLHGSHRPGQVRGGVPIRLLRELDNPCAPTTLAEPRRAPPRRRTRGAHRSGKWRRRAENGVLPHGAQALATRNRPHVIRLARLLQRPVRPLRFFNPCRYRS